MASQRVAPSAYAPSRCACGTDLSTSRATDELNGMTMIARISAADSMPTPSGGPLKSGRAAHPLRRRDLELADERHQDEDAPEAVDDRRNRGQQLGQEDERLCGGRFGASSEMKMAMPSAIGVEMRSARTDE